MAKLDVVIIGAGPYGLSAAAHLKSAGMDVRVFGKSMDFWATKMPVGMLLRSPRIASTISDPANSGRIEVYERKEGLPPTWPVPLTNFVEYGKWFQRELVSDLDTREVASVEPINGGFRTLLRDGTSVDSIRVVVAAGIGPFQRIPPVLQNFSVEQVSHCYSGTDIRAFSGKKVVVVGAGQSALESAALLHENGADVEVLIRNPIIRWIGQHPWLHKMGPISSMMYSSHDIGPAGISRMVAAPNFMKHVPLGWRDKIRKRAVRAAGAPWLRNRLENVRMNIGRRMTEARSAGSQVELKLDDGSSIRADHVLLGTGYDVDISRFSFLSPQLLKDVRTFNGYPILDAGLHSSVPGLHFSGAAAARSFGPLLYFVCGTDFASRELTSSIAKSRGKK